MSRMPLFRVLFSRVVIKINFSNQYHLMRLVVNPTHRFRKSKITKNCRCDNLDRVGLAALKVVFKFSHLSSNQLNCTAKRSVGIPTLGCPTKKRLIDQLAGQFDTVGLAGISFRRV